MSQVPTRVSGLGDRRQRLDVEIHNCGLSVVDDISDPGGSRRSAGMGRWLSHRAGRRAKVRAVRSLSTPAGERPSPVTTHSLTYRRGRDEFSCSLPCVTLRVWALRPTIRTRAVNMAPTLAPSTYTTSPAFAAATSEAPPRAAKAATSWTALPSGVIDGGEIVLLAVKPSMWRPLFDSGAWLATCCTFAIVLTSFGRPLAGLSATTTAQIILLIGIARLAFAVVRWVPSWYVLTNRRIIEIQGVRRPLITDCGLLDIRNTAVQMSPAEKLTRLGTIVFVIDHGSQVPRTWRTIAEPEEVHARIRRAIETAIDQQGLGA